MPARNDAALAFLKSRRSRPAKLFSLPVPTCDQLKEILTAATRVPDHGKLQPWRLVVVQGAAFKRLADLSEARARELGGDDEMIGKGRGQYDQGKLAVVVIASPRPSPKIPATEQLLSPDTAQQVNDLMTEFWATDMSAADAQARYAEIIANAE